MTRATLIALMLLLSCSNSKTERSDKNNSTKNQDTVSIKKTEPYVYCNNLLDSIWKILDKNIVAPNEIVENSFDTNIHKLDGHLIRLELDIKNNKSLLKIDQDKFKLWNIPTLNKIWDDRIDTLDYIYYFKNIRLYKIPSSDLIYINLGISQCNGIACSVDYTLLYYVKNHRLNVFGSFQAFQDLEVYDINNDKVLDFISRTWKGETFGNDYCARRLELFTLDYQGKFNLSKDSLEHTHFIEVTYPDGEAGTCKLTKNWPK